MNAQYTQFVRLKKAYVTFLREIDWQYALTLNFNTHATPESARKVFKRFCARLDRLLFGKNWADRDPDERCLIIVRSEHEDGKYHLHGIIRVPLDRQRANIDSLVDRAWQKTIRRGSAFVRKRETEQGWLEYLSKKSTPATVSDFLNSRDFMR